MEIRRSGSQPSGKGPSEWFTGVVRVDPLFSPDEPARAGAAQERPSVAPKSMQAIAPGLADDTDRVLFGDVWLRPQLAPRDRSLVTLAVLIATGKTAQMGGHLGRGLANGLKPVEIAGMVTHLAFHAGWPNAVSALEVIERTFTERGIDVAALRRDAGTPGRTTASNRVGPEAEVPGAGADPLAPRFAELTHDVIFGDLWHRSDLTPRDRSLVTLSALAAAGDLGGFGEEVRRGSGNGLTKVEIGEALTHLAFYAGWPKASAAISVATKALDGPAPGPKVQVVPPGRSPVAVPAANFTGSAFLTSSFKGTGGASLGGGTVTFQPGARTNWHTHPLGQLLVVTEGRGWVQAEGEPVRAITAGDTVWIGPGVRHWHGATRTGAMTHVAVAESADGRSVVWLEPVTEGQYAGP